MKICRTIHLEVKQEEVCLKFYKVIAVVIKYGKCLPKFKKITITEHY